MIKKILETIYGKDSAEMIKFVSQASHEVDKTKKECGKEEPEKPPEENQKRISKLLFSPRCS